MQNVDMFRNRFHILANFSNYIEVDASHFQHNSSSFKWFSPVHSCTTAAIHLNNFSRDLPLPISEAAWQCFHFSLELVIKIRKNMRKIQIIFPFTVYLREYNSFLLWLWSLFYFILNFELILILFYDAPMNAQKWIYHMFLDRVVLHLCSLRRKSNYFLSYAMATV